MVSFVALGKPTTQGSYRPIVSKSTRKAIMVPMMSDAMRAWRSTVSQAARSAMGSRSPLSGCVQIAVRFILPRPKKPSNEWPRGDCDKLQRALGDALTGIVYADDSQICRWVACKEYGHPTGAQVEITEL